MLKELALFNRTYFCWCWSLMAVALLVFLLQKLLELCKRIVSQTFCESGEVKTSLSLKECYAHFSTSFSFHFSAVFGSWCWLGLVFLKEKVSLLMSWSCVVIEFCLTKKNVSQSAFSIVWFRQETQNFVFRYPSISANRKCGFLCMLKVWDWFFSFW